MLGQPTPCPIVLQITPMPLACPVAFAPVHTLVFAPMVNAHCWTGPSVARSHNWSHVAFRFIPQVLYYVLDA